MALQLALVINAVERGFGAFDRAGGGLSGLVAGAKAASAQLAALAATAVVQFAADAVTTFADFDTQVRRAAATIKDGIPNFEALTQAAKDMGATTAFSASQAATALEFLGLAGFNTQQAIAALPNVLDLATVGALDLKVASDIATDVMGAFGLAVDQLPSVVDILAAASTNANASVTQFGDSLFKVGPVAESMNIPLTDTTTALGILANAGIKGARSGTQLKIVLQRLQNATEGTEDSLRAAGVQIDEFQAGQISLETVLRQIQTAIEGGAEGLSAFGLVGSEAQAAFQILLNSVAEGESSFGDLSTAIDNSEGRAEEFVEFMAEGPGFAFKEFEAAVESLKIELGTALMPLVLDLINLFKDNRDSIAEVLIVVGELVARLGDLLPFVQQIFDAFLVVWDLFSELDVWEGFIDVLTRVFEALEELGPILPILVAALIAITAPLLTTIFLIAFFSDEIIILIDVLVAVVNGIVNFVLWTGFLIAEVLRITGVLGFFEDAVTDLQEPFNDLIDLLKDAWEWVVKLGDAVADSPIGKFGSAVGELFTTRPPGFQAGGIVRDTGIALVHAGEQITNPRLAQEPPGGGGRNLQVNQTFNVANPDALMMENQTRRYLRRLRFR